MREILFRGKRVDNGEWIEGQYVRDINRENASSEDLRKFAHKIQPLHYTHAYMFPVDPLTVCQYTGLTEKNGRKIFEGDIINDIDYGIMKCIYLHGSFVWYKEDGFKIECMRYVPVIEVIGNIFDNPELISDSE